MQLGHHEIQVLFGQDITYFILKNVFVENNRHKQIEICRDYAKYYGEVENNLEMNLFCVECRDYLRQFLQGYLHTSIKNHPQVLCGVIVELRIIMQSKS